MFIEIVCALVVSLAALYTKFSSKPRDKVSSGVNLNAQTVLLPGPERIRRSALSPDKLVERLHDDVQTLYDNFLRGVRIGGDSPCLGTRRGDVFQFESYNQIMKRVTDFASGLLAVDVQPGQKTFVGLYSQNRAEWVIAEQAANSQSMVLVPLYDTLGADAVKFIVNQADISVVICDLPKLKPLLKQLPQLPSVKRLIVMGDVSAEDKAEAKDGKVQLYSFAEIESRGHASPAGPNPPSREDLATICYTSGTTGDPKGAMLTHGNLVADSAGAAWVVLKSSVGSIGPDDLHISYLPLAHMFERVVQVWVLGNGARIAFFRGDVKLLPDDIKVARPTIFCSVPRLLNRIYDKVLMGVNSSSIVVRTLFAVAFAAKKAEVESGIIRKDSLWDKLVFHKVQDSLGGRLRFVLTGAAPISPACLTFLRVAFGCPVMEGYGQTECTAGATLTVLGDSHPGSVGMVLPCGEIRLDSVPEMKYFAENDEGEVCFRGPHVMRGYLKADDKTKEAIDSQGWLHSGDIGRFLPNGTLKIFDRKKAIFKLAQGEYIAPEKIENVYTRAASVAQCFVYGNSLEATLVCIVVPDFDVLPKWLPQNCPSVSPAASPAELCANPAVQKAIFDEMIATGKAQNLHSFEQVRLIRLIPEAFTVENGLLTPTFKSKRPQLQQAFQPLIDEMYKEIHKMDANKAQN